MAIVEELIIYPVKSCGGLAVEEAVVAPDGLAAGGIGDREWMLVREDGSFLTQREAPRMALVRPTLAADALLLHAPEMPPLALPLRHGADLAPRQVQLWDDSLLGADCGDDAAAWFSTAIGVACRVVRFLPEVVRPTSTKWTGGLAASSKFADAYPILLIGRASLDDLNDKLRAAGRAPLPMNRFRPNIVVGRTEAFDEDYTASFMAGALELRPVKPCPRCPVPSIDQATGIAGPDPLDILRTYRTKPQMEDAICFGMNVIVAAGAGTVLRVGQALEPELAF